MDVQTVALHAAVLIAALLQAATGIGFGVLAGPVILLTLNSGSAIQISMLLSLLIAAVLTPSLWRRVDRTLLKRILLGSLAGFPIGILIFRTVGIDTLKLLAGAAVLYMALSVAGFLGGSKQGGRASRARDIGVGVVSGLMNTSLAMPGPPVAARMAVLQHSKDSIRATVLVTFVFSYILAVAFQAALVGIARETLVLTAWLAPTTLAGVLIGRLAAGRFTEHGFRIAIAVLLAATSLSLFIHSLAGLLGYV